MRVSTALHSATEHLVKLYLLFLLLDFTRFLRFVISSMVPQCSVLYNAMQSSSRVGEEAKRIDTDGSGWRMRGHGRRIGLLQGMLHANLCHAYSILFS